MSDFNHAPNNSFPQVLTRRQFLRRLGITTGAALSTSLLTDLNTFAQAAPEQKRASTTGQPIHVVILGAGLAGLCAAYELEKLGHKVTILEAESKHIGGRARTLRFGNGLYGEAGAMRIPLRHELTRHYVKEMGLALRPFVHFNPEAYYFLRNQRVRIKDAKKLNAFFELAANERDQTPDDWWKRAVTDRAFGLSDAEKADLTANSFSTSGVGALDQLSLQQVLENSGLSPEALELLAVTYGSETSLPTAATEALREELLEVWSKDFHEIVGGTDTLATALAARLKSKPKLGCEVIQIEQNRLLSRAAAIYKERGKTQRVEGDFVLCTLPFSVLGRLQLPNDFSGSKQRAIRQLNYDSSTKVLAITKQRFWESEDKIFGGGTYTDLPTGTTYYPSNNAQAKDPSISSSESVFLASYTWGQAARRLASLEHAEREKLTLEHLSRVHPQLQQKGMVHRTASWCWDTHRWSSGAFSWFLPGQHSALHRHIIAPEGRVHFAGEHASLTHTWMQGAFESALRAVREMLAAS